MKYINGFLLFQEFDKAKIFFYEGCNSQKYILFVIKVLEASLHFSLKKIYKSLTKLQPPDFFLKWQTNTISWSEDLYLAFI